ncbi:glycerophosphodiester phosphodiesterase family protein [Brevibacterium album]|uniref:glycerophosphodiester phosphodiesterase family protein n=1 Tax=Brevibacterium album TaxID=417948 RepID=UPI0004177C8A|nr:glycerophosphodiester phosphodiesterase family protein [Brevibacterium album]
MPHPYLSGDGPRVLAHRGLVTPEMAAAGVVENSAAAVAAAAATGAAYVESDCHLTADGTVVLFHDDSLERLTGDPRTLAEVTVDELRELMAARGGLLTLTEALGSFPGLRFNIDVKADAAAAPAGALIGPHWRRCLLTSFSDSRRRRALAAAQAVPGGRRPATSPGEHGVAALMLAALTGSRRLAHRALSGLDAAQIPERQGILPVLTPALLDTAHAGGVEVHVWTVNDPARMRALTQAGVDGLVTDRADLALRLIRSQGPRSSPV